jgi:hypothetical protein
MPSISFAIAAGYTQQQSVCVDQRLGIVDQNTLACQDTSTTDHKHTQTHTKTHTHTQTHTYTHIHTHTHTRTHTHTHKTPVPRDMRLTACPDIAGPDSAWSDMRCNPSCSCQPRDCLHSNIRTSAHVYTYICNVYHSVRMSVRICVRVIMQILAYAGRCVYDTKAVCLSVSVCLEGQFA